VDQLVLGSAQLSALLGEHHWPDRGEAPPL
jgi:hypothetical protein